MPVFKTGALNHYATLPGPSVKPRGDYFIIELSIEPRDSCYTIYMTDLDQRPEENTEEQRPSNQPDAHVPGYQEQAHPDQEATHPSQQHPEGSSGPQPEMIILEWEAPNRPFKKRNRQYYTTIAIIVFLISMILFFAGQFLPIAVVIAVAFLAYVLSAVPPETIVNRITTYGIRTDNALYYWDVLGRFWFSNKYGQRLLHVEVAHFPSQLTLLLGDQSEEEVTSVLSEVLLLEKPPLTTFDKAAKWLEEKIPLDTDS
jgi:hypothetical protein